MASDEKEIMVFSLMCPRCHKLVSFPPDMKPEINTIAECLCGCNILITGIKQHDRENNNAKAELEVIQIPEEEMEKLDRDGQLEEMYLAGEK